MRETQVAVQCEFDPDGKPVSEVLAGSFAAFLRRVLAQDGPEAEECEG